MPTNATDPVLAQSLTSIDRMLPVSLVTRKKGVVRGAGLRKRTFGDDKVHVLMLTGFDYKDLVARSEKKLMTMSHSGTMFHDLVAEARNAGHTDVTIEDACFAVQEVRDWLTKAQGTGDPDAKYEGSVWEPLERDGVKVPGCKVYVGEARPDDERAPVPGDVYLQGLKLTEKVLEAAENGDWVTNSSGKTILKNLLRRKLPVGRYVSYIVNPVRGDILHVGPDAVRAADADGLEIPAGVADNLLRMSGEPASR